MVKVEVFVFYRNGSQINIVGKVFDRDGGAILVRVDFVKEFAISVKDLGRNWSRIAREGGGVGDVFKEDNGDGDDDSEERESKDD